MSRFVASLRAVVTAPNTSVSTPTSPTSHNRSKSNDSNTLGQKRYHSDASSRLKLPFYNSIHDVSYPEFVADLRKANPGRSIGQQQADEAKDILVRRFVGSTTVEKARRAERQGKGGTLEGDTARLESMRLVGESAKYWNEVEREEPGIKKSEDGHCSQK